MRLTEQEVDTLEMGTIFGKYELVERIATGGMAEIFKAASISVGGFRKLVALKRILPHLCQDAEFVSLFISEAKLAVTLNHGNIVGLVDFGQVGNSYYQAMELVDGRDMTQILTKQARTGRPVPVDVACYILNASLLGLEHAHTRLDSSGRPLEIVHRDVSPHNVMVSYDGEVKLTDFGIAKARTRAAVSRPGMILGKYAYMSPEQAKGAEVDARSDVYAAAVTLYETLTSQRLFYCDDPDQTLAKVREPNIEPPSSVNPMLPKELDDIVMTGLAVNPGARFQSARAFANELQAFLRDNSGGFNDSHLARFMKGLYTDEVGARRFSMAADHPAPLRLSTPPEPEVPTTSVFDDPILIALQDRLQEELNLWTLVEIGKRLEKLGHPNDAVRTFSVGAIKFAQNGLLVQAIALSVQIRELMGWSEEQQQQAMALPGLAGVLNAQAREFLPPLDTDPLGILLKKVFEAAEPSDMATALSKALFSFLSNDELARLTGMLRLHRVVPGTAIVEEGERGESLFIIARGRVIVYCRNFHRQKVYLTSLADGDCFGEFSFFTGRARAATIEALDEVMLFEIQQKDFDTILVDFPGLTNALLGFYKARVVSTLLAKSELFGVLPAATREELAGQLVSEGYQRNDVVISEGDPGSGFYVIKSGEVEVYRDQENFLFLRKLKSGDFFGEIAAIQQSPRTASVRALGPVELLTISGQDLRELAEKHPRMREVLLARITERKAATEAAMVPETPTQ